MYKPVFHMEYADRSPIIVTDVKAQNKFCTGFLYCLENNNRLERRS